jgi:hypothetical protein
LSVLAAELDHSASRGRQIFVLKKANFCFKKSNICLKKQIFVLKKANFCLKKSKCLSAV